MQKIEAQQKKDKAAVDAEKDKKKKEDLQKTTGEKLLLLGERFAKAFQKLIAKQSEDYKKFAKEKSKPQITAFGNNHKAIDKMKKSAIASNEKKKRL